jgi:hypothetical protein
MKIKKRRSHHVSVESRHARNGSVGEPSCLLTGKIKTVRHSGKHSAAGNEGIGASNLDKAAARSHGNSDCIEREGGHLVSMCQQARRTDHGNGE